MKPAEILLTLALPVLIASLSFHQAATTTPENSTQNKTDSTPKPCAFNEIASLEGQKEYNFSLKTQKTPNFTASDFEIKGWKETKQLNHQFFKWVGKTASFHDNFIHMGCQLTDKATFSKVCNIPAATLEDVYKKAFGQDIIFKCRVPDNHVAFGVEFLAKENDLKIGDNHWSVFAGLKPFKAIDDVKKEVQDYGTKFIAEVKSSKLTVLNIDQQLHFSPEINQKLLTDLFNNNPKNTFVINLKEKVEHPVSGYGLLKVLPPGTQFIIGSISNGTPNVKQICENISFTEAQSCGVKF